MWATIVAFIKRHAKKFMSAYVAVSISAGVAYGYFNVLAWSLATGTQLVWASMFVGGIYGLLLCCIPLAVLHLYQEWKKCGE